MKFVRNSTKYMSVKHIWNLSSVGYWSCLLAVKLQIYLEILSLPGVNNIPKLPCTGEEKTFCWHLYGVWKETAVCSNAGTCLIIRAGHLRLNMCLHEDMFNCTCRTRSKTQECFDFTNGFEVIYQKRVRVFHNFYRFQTPRKTWEHNAKGRVLLLFLGVWSLWWNLKHTFWYCFSNENRGNCAVTCYLKQNNKKLCSVEFLPFFRKNTFACMIH